MRTGDFEAVDLGHSLLLEDPRFKRLGTRASAVRADKMERRSRPRHDNASDAASLQGYPTGLFQIDPNRFGNSISTPGKFDRPIRRFAHGAADGLGIVGNPIALCSELPDTGPASRRSGNRREKGQSNSSIHAHGPPEADRHRLTSPMLES